ncbi:hypothetical protein L3X38_004465 [Prunus dulcis]|uniref:Uncharacterized protein n=1 Tax=Prunus dulcis TaxID=3755 RepID=A0AAD5F379_PRUDU|nr:hypothetical protein L3X38_004465 [Prunus dulcis]
MKQFIQRQTATNQKNAQDIGEIKSTLSKLTSSLSIQEKGKFPSQVQPNPHAQLEVTTPSSSSLNENKHEYVKPVTTLRSGKIIGKDDLVAVENKKNLEKSKNNEKENHDYEIVKCPFLAPFPQALKVVKKNQNPEILEVFKQVKINIPLLDAIKQIPSYSKFLKDLCTIKRKQNVDKTAFLTENVSVILQTNTPPKYKDPGCPTISYIIGNFIIEQALLDLGASVNLLPYSVYKQLGLGKLKPTSITLQLADRSVKIPRGMVEDVLVQVEKFYFPVDFIVLDTEPVVYSNSQIPIILGRPFLATSNAHINCRNGLMQLSFGNTTLELNIFNICK